MLRALVIDAGKCTGCKQCEMACSYVKEGEFNVSKSRIRVFDFHTEARFVPYTCTQCAEAWCQQACPVNAITTNAEGVKVVHENLCVGCKVCTIACPFGTINYNASTGKVIKCDTVPRQPGLRRRMSNRRHHVPGYRAGRLRQDEDLGDTGGPCCDTRRRKRSHSERLRRAFEI